MALHRVVKMDGYTCINPLGEAGKWKIESRFVYECTHGLIPEKYDIRHVDGNYRNHSPQNLIAIDPVQHQFRHIMDRAIESECMYCGCNYIKKREYHLYCSDECRQAANDSKRGIIRQTERNCLYCSKGFTIRPRYGKQLYCSITCRNYHGRDKRYATILNHRVISAEFHGYEDVYNMEVENDHNFVANGIVVHNCDDMMENLYRLCLLDTQYSPPEPKDDDWERIGQGERLMKNKMTGY